MLAVSWFVTELIAVILGCKVASVIANLFSAAGWWVRYPRLSPYQRKRGEFRWRLNRALMVGDTSVTRVTRCEVTGAIGNSIDGIAYESEIVRVPVDPLAELWGVVDALYLGARLRRLDGPVTFQTARWRIEYLVFRSDADREDFVTELERWKGAVRREAAFLELEMSMMKIWRDHERAAERRRFGPTLQLSIDRLKAEHPGGKAIERMREFVASFESWAENWQREHA